MGQPFSDTPFPVVGAAAERVFMVDRTAATSPRGATYGVVALRSNGDTLWNRRYSYVPRPLERSSVDSALDARIRPGSPPAYRDQLRSQMVVPAFRPPVSTAFVAADGSLWLKREDGGPDVDYTVLAPNGDVAGMLTLKRTVAIRAVNGNAVWAVETDADGVPTVVRYRITR
jgi:hypothetical protein